MFGTIALGIPAVWSRAVLPRVPVATICVVSTATPAVSVAYLAALGMLGGVQGWLLSVGIIGVAVGAFASLHQRPSPASAPSQTFA